MNFSLRQQFGRDPSDAALREAFTRPPEIIDEVVDYLDTVSSQWVFDPTKIRLPRTGRFSQAVDKATAQLAEAGDGALVVPVFYDNLEVLAKHSKSDDIDGTPLALRLDHEGPDSKVYIREEVADINVIGGMTAALQMATNAKVLRDDFAEAGNNIGARTFKGAVRGAPVYFSEFIAQDPSSPEDDPSALGRVIVAETLASARDTLRGLSDFDLELLERAEIPLPPLESPALGTNENEAPFYLRAERSGRPRMIETLRLYALMSSEK